MRQRGVRTLFYLQVDNPLVQIADPAFLGLHRQAGAEMSLLGPLPRSNTRPPAGYVPAILFVVCPEFVPQSRLFVESDKQVHAERDDGHRRDRRRISVAKHNPQPDPTHR